MWPSGFTVILSFVQKVLPTSVALNIQTKLPLFQMFKYGKGNR